MKKKLKARRNRPNLILTPETADATPPSSFAFALTRTAVGQICRSAGFKGTHLSALDVLTRVAALYLRTLAASAASTAASANRSQSNLADVVSALHDLSSVPGFPGAASLHRDDAALLSSAALADLHRFVRLAAEVPFAKPIPRPPPPIATATAATTTTDSARGPHVPEWLPDYPNARMERSSVKAESTGRDKLWEEATEVTEGNENEPPPPPEAARGGKLPAKRPKVRFKLKCSD